MGDEGADGGVRRGFLRGGPRKKWSGEVDRKEETMKVHGKVLAAMLLVFLTAGPAWAAFCWRTSDGGIVKLELGDARGDFIPVMGAFIGTATDPVCLGFRVQPIHGIAKIIGNVALLGFTAYAEGSVDCGPAMGEFSIDLTTLVWTGFVRNAPHFDFPKAETLTPVTCP